MATTTRGGTPSTRIPLFGPRLGARSRDPPATAATAPREASRPRHEPGARDVGRRVRVADREGTLRFVGPVRFAAGTWCGVELDAPVGKHDGYVNGARYFACPPLCGLMSIIAKVSLVDEIAVDAVSGPYSMVFDVCEKTIVPKPTLVRSETFDKDLPTSVDLNKTQVLFNPNFELSASTPSANRPIDLNATLKMPDDSPIATTGNRTYEVLDDTIPGILNLTITKTLNETFERPRSYPITNENIGAVKKATAPVCIQTRKSTNLASLRSTRSEEGNKRDSLEFDESLGILAISHLNDLTLVSRSPSSENIQSLPNDGVLNKDLPSILDVSELSLFMITNENKPTKLVLNSKPDYVLTRIEQTPSPEELPLDPTPVLEPTVVPTKTNFITSVTSITSIDTGYQGDGEMSRPTSRGADNSPLTRRPVPRPPVRRPDPMTDSDFYTESDADHEDHKDRKARIIDGTLYNPDPQSSTEIYTTTSQKENMDSSGIFTDLEGKQPEEKPDPEDKTTIISDTSPNELREAMEVTSPDSRNVSDSTVKEVPLKRRGGTTANSSAASSPTSARSPRHTPSDDVKKHKVVKRNVTSKVKAILESTAARGTEKTPVQKKAGRWDAVMNKISKSPGEQLKNNLKEIKSKVFSTIHGSGNKAQGQKEPANGSRQNKSPNNKVRRTRVRSTNNTNSPTTTSNTKTNNSINSSLSDLSGATPIKKFGSAKKQREVFRGTPILITNATPKPNRITTTVNNSEPKKTTPATNDAKSTVRKNLFNAKDKKKEIVAKGKTNPFLLRPKCNRNTVKGGRVSPATRSPQQQRAPLKPQPRTAEALAVLVQHLVFNVEAFRVPSLKKEVQKLRTDAEEARLSCQHLEEKLHEVNAIHAAAIEEERAKYRAEIASLLEQHRNTVTQVKNEKTENERKLQSQIQNLSAKFEKLEKEHADAVTVFREENESIREQIDKKNAAIDNLKAQKCESDKLKRSYKEHNNALEKEIAALREEIKMRLQYDKHDGNTSIQEVLSLRAVLDLKQEEIQDLRKTMATMSQKVDTLPALEEKLRIYQAKCEDLSSQLDRKNLYESQLAKEKKKLEDSLTEELKQKRCLVQRNEELQWKLQQNKEVVTKVIEQAEEGSFGRSILSTSFNERYHHHHNHHHQHRHHLERALSFRETTRSSGSRKSKNPHDLDLEDSSTSPPAPSSPKVKGVVEKTDSVSYVLEMDESPEVVASRIVRRSFRNTTPPKSTPTKSPSNKRPRIKTNPLSLSSSAGAIISSKPNGLDSSDHEIFSIGIPVTSTPRRVNNEDDDDDGDECDQPCKLDDSVDIDEEHDVRVQIPSLPSEIGRNGENLPMPRRLAGEAMIFEMNSDDESSTSSSSGQL